MARQRTVAKLKLESRSRRLALDRSDEEAEMLKNGAAGAEQAAKGLCSAGR
jgi:hypothetical protein